MAGFFDGSIHRARKGGEYENAIPVTDDYPDDDYLTERGWTPPQGEHG